MNIDLGRVTPIYRGAYNAAVRYELNDIVLHTDGNLYWHVSPVATTGVAPTDTSAWMLAFSGDDVEAAIEQIKEDAEAIALGTRGGFPVDSADPYYHNNAAWYASQASASATAAGNAKTAAETAQGAAETARDKSAQWATGGTSGTPGASNNAKYYAEQAASSATSADGSAASAEAWATGGTSGTPSATNNAKYFSEQAAASAASVDANEINRRILASFPHDAASGAVVSFGDGADGIPIRSLVAQIIPVQAGSGDPSPVNQRPISGWTGTRVVQSSSVNAVDPVANAVEQGGIASADGQDTQTETRLRTKGFIPVKPGEQYTASWTADAGSGVGLQAYWYFYGSDKGYLRNGGAWTGSGAVSGSSTVLIDSDVRYARLLFRKFGDSAATLTADMVTSLQLEIGSTATAYQPGSAATEKVISWQSAAGTVYGGTLTDNGDGTWTLVNAMVGVDLGTLTWTYDSDSGTMVAAYTSSLPLKTGSSHNPCICEIYKTDVSAIDFYSSDDVACINNGRRTSQQTIQVRDSAYTDAEVFKAAMDGIMFVYDMATPQTYTIAADSVMTLLGGNVIWADTGDVSVDYRADPTLYIAHITASLQALILDN